MKTFTLTTALLFINLFVFAQEKDTLVYSSKKIDWNCFKGIPKGDSLTAAAISTTICLEVKKVSIWDGRVTFKSYAVLYPYESWVKPDYQNEFTLLHEQTHFDISETCARALEAEINKMKIRSVKSPMIQSTFDKWVIRLAELQKEYDKETKGGNDPVAQNLWIAKITAELNSY